MGLGCGYAARIVTSQCAGKMSQGLILRRWGEIFFSLPRPALGTTQPGSSSNTFDLYLGVCQLWEPHNLDQAVTLLAYI
jgi:hypothetical protein